MSECVVRMEMPKCCEDCAAEYDCMACGITGTPWYESEEFNPSNGRLPDCPIICQLPEGHGRLVDEKEVKDWVENWLCVNKYYHPYSSSKFIPMSELYDVIQRMDAAVPAERSEI